MLNRFAPDGIVPEEFKLPSFNHVLHQRKNTKMYQVIFFNRHLFTHPFISTFQRLHKSHQALSCPIKPLFKSPHTIWCERSHHLIRALTPFDVSAHIKWCEITLTMTDFTLHFSCCFTKSLHSHFIPLLNNFTMQEKCC